MRQWEWIRPNSLFGDQTNKLFPCQRMLNYPLRHRKLYCILRDARRLADFFDLAQDYFAQGIEQRLIDTGRLSNLSKSELAARANALAACSPCAAGRWTASKKDPAARMDKMPHRMVWNGLR